jgi:putative glutamine amidotransferase
MVRTNSLHHQAVDQLGTGLRITGSAEDGVVEAIETLDDTWCVGVQWHPELMPDDRRQQALVGTFVDRCRSHRQQRESPGTLRPIVTSNTGRAS